jgi:hypothetical protein
MNRVLEFVAETPMAVSVGGPAILSESSAVEEFGKEIEFNRVYDLKNTFADFVKLMTESCLSRLRYLTKLSWGAPQTSICPLLQNLSSLRPLDLMVHGGLDQAAGVWRKKISAAGNKMTMETSSKGGFDIVIGYYKVHVPKYASVHHPLIQMVLFARTLYDSTLRCLQSVAPKSIVEFNNAEGLVSTKTKAHSPNTVSASKDVENYRQFHYPFSNLQFSF